MTPSRLNTSVVAVVACGLLVIAVGLVFGRAVTFDFVSIDDEAYIVDERHIQQGITPPTIHWAFTNLEHGLWIPLVWLSYMIDYVLYGLKPAGWHLTNIVLHAATTTGMFLLLYRLPPASSVWRSGFAAALFTLHPLRAESVIWVTERKDMLAGLCTIATVAAYVDYVRRPRAIGYAVLTACFGLALASKPSAVPLPVALLLLDVWPLARMPSDPGMRPAAVRRLVLEKVPLLAMSLAASVVTILGVTRAFSPQTMFDRFCRMLIGYAEYARRMVYPLNLALQPEAPSASPEGVGEPWEIVMSLAVVVGVSLLAYRLRRQQPALLAGWAWYCVMLLPVSGVVSQGLEPRPDRFAYLPHMGLAVAIVWFAADMNYRFFSNSAVPKGRQFRLGLAGGLITIAVVSILGWRQVGFWRNSRTLWERTLACDPDNAWARNSLGKALAAEGLSAEAADHYRRALEIAPDFAMAHYSVALAHHAAGNLDEAIASYVKVISLDPSFGLARNNLGNVFIQLGRFTEAMDTCTHAERLLPDNPKVQFNLGVALLRNGEPEQAVERFRTAIRLLPNEVPFYNKLAESLLETGRPADAKNAAETAIRLRPNYPAARLNLGISLLKLGFTAEAAEQLQIARRQAIQANQLPVSEKAAATLQSMNSETRD